MRSSRVRSLLGLTANEPAKGKPPAEVVNANHVNDTELAPVAASKHNSVPAAGVTAKEPNIFVKRYCSLLFLIFTYGDYPLLLNIHTITLYNISLKRYK